MPGDTVAPFPAFTCFVDCLGRLHDQPDSTGTRFIRADLRGLLLVSGGVGIKSTMTNTLLLRGFTLWIPMIPGLLLTRRAID